MSLGLIERIRLTAPYWWAPQQLLFYVGCVGLRNLGDELMLPTFRRLFPDLTMAYHWPVGPSRIQRMIEGRDHRAALLGGGTLIVGDANHRSYRRFERALNRCGRGMVFGTGVFGAGPQPMATARWKRLRQWEQLLSRCPYVGVRGPHSARVLGEMGVAAEVLGDPVCQHVLERAPSGSPRPTIGVNVGLIHDGACAGHANLLEAMEQLIVHAAKKGLQTELFVVRPGDEETTRVLASRVGSAVVRIHSVYDDVEKYLWSVKDLLAFVGIKLHATALAACAGVPAISVAYEAKCHDFMDSIGLTPQAIDPEGTSGQSLVAALDRLLDSGQATAEAACQRMRAFKRLQQRRAAELKAAITRESAWPDVPATPARACA